jgi:hypothetical protein
MVNRTFIGATTCHTGLSQSIGDIVDLRIACLRVAAADKVDMDQYFFSQ